MLIYLGKVYYYNAATRATQWSKPEGPDVKILTQEEVERLQKKVGGGGGSGAGDSADKQAGGGQGPAGDGQNSREESPGPMDRGSGGPGRPELRFASIVILFGSGFDVLDHLGSGSILLSLVALIFDIIYFKFS